MAWQCFVDDKTGRSYKSRVAATCSSIDISDRITPSASLSTLLALLPFCQDDRHQDEGSLRTVILVSFDEDMIPRVPSQLLPPSDTWQVYADDRRQREMGATTLEQLKNSLQVRLQCKILFLYTYGTEAKQRTVQALRKANTAYTETPIFSCMDDFLTYVNKLLKE